VATEFIMVPVPRERVQEVYRLLAVDPVPPGALSAEATTAEVVPWSDAEIVRAYNESPQKMKLFLDYLASVPGQSVTAEETAKAVGYTRHQQAGMLGAFGHRVKRRYSRSTWFFTYEWNDQRGDGLYSMEAAVAGVVRDIKSMPV